MIIELVEREVELCQNDFIIARNKTCPSLPYPHQAQMFPVNETDLSLAR
jgi:hypothetical protein